MHSTSREVFATSAEVPVHGICDTRFTALLDQFLAHFHALGETGAALAVMLDGKLVVDVWAGHSDAARTQPWQHDSIVNVYSTTKGITALCAHRLVEHGRLDLDAPVARYWPEFAAAGKDTLPVRYLLSHQAGLAAVREPLNPSNLSEWDTVTRALARQAPWWEPGTKHGYHAMTYGWLVGEVIRRISGRSVGAFFRDEIGGPLGIDFHIGFGPELDARVAALIPPPPPGPNELDLLAEILKEPESLLAKSFINPPVLPELGNTREWRAAELPAANGHTNARALARLYGTLACGGSLDGVHVLAPATIEQASAEQADGPDALLPLHTRFALGFMLSTPTEKMGPNPRTFGHGGMGGSLAFADPEARLGFGYVMNEMHAGLWLIDPRPRQLIDVLYQIL
jgi:CubicO group peptidase (beta-lactamase class C family)